MVHNYFFLKALDAVHDGGVVAFITSQGVMDSPTSAPIREEMLRHADLVSAVRLPNNLFTENANTEVGSDLIILQKNTAKTGTDGNGQSFHQRGGYGWYRNKCLFRGAW